MGKVNLCSKRKYRQEEYNPGDRGPHPNTKWANNTLQGYHHYSRNIICENNTIIPEPEQKNYFTIVHYPAYRKANTIYIAFNEEYIYYRKPGFMILTLHTDWYFATLQAMIT